MRMFTLAGWRVGWLAGWLARWLADCVSSSVSPHSPITLCLKPPKNFLLPSTARRWMWGTKVLLFAAGVASFSLAAPLAAAARWERDAADGFCSPMKAHR